MLGANCGDLIRGAHGSAHVNQQDAPGVRPDLLLEIGGVHAEGIVDIDEFGDGAAAHNGGDAGDPHITGDQYLIARADAESRKSQRERGGSAVDGDCISSIEPLAIGRFNPLDAALQIGTVEPEGAASIENFQCLFDFLGSDVERARPFVGKKISFSNYIACHWSAFPQNQFSWRLRPAV